MKEKNKTKRKITTTIINYFQNIILRDKDIFLKLSVTLMLFAAIFLTIVLKPIGKIFTPQLGAIVNYDIVADTDIKYINKVETEKNITAIKLKTPPVFLFDISKTNERLTVLTTLLDKLFIANDIKETADQFYKIGMVFSYEEIESIKQIIEINPEFTKRFVELLFNYSNEGIIESKVASDVKYEKSGIIIITNIDNRIDETLYYQDELSRFSVNLKELRENIDSSFAEYDKNKRNLIYSIFNRVLVPNILIDETQTSLRLQNVLQKQANVYNTIKKGQIIARKGDLITESNIEQIESINKLNISNFSFLKLLTTALLIVLVFIFSCFFIKLGDNNFFKELENLILFAILFFLYALFLSLPSYLGYNTDSLYFGYLIPTSTLTMTFTFLYSKSISTHIAILSSILFFILSDYNVSSFIFVFFSGVSTVFIINKISKRFELIRAGFIVSLFNILASLFIYFTLDNESISLIRMVIFSLINGVASSILALGFISVGEILINTPTIFRLQELSDLSSPLLKELFNSAIGTYNHSILVANLAETAATEINANGPLSRIGGYYHDIGKIDNPEYFIENQGEYNIHDDLKPSISVTIIKSHVKKGVEKLAKHKLPSKVIDIVAQHHGSSLIKFFYEKALKETDSSKEDIKEDFYHYNGLKPQFQESAIVLLADQVEAATRSLKKTSIMSIEKMVDSIIYKNYEEGILDDSGLTLKDLSKIKAVFVKSLAGMYHSRIEYPNKPEPNRLPNNSES
ncbi:MAG: HDIG domain-containing protein [Spirochaetes bacterium]|nr:HDIG domain-containing protein [Spirochaetota bacterium]